MGSSGSSGNKQYMYAQMAMQKRQMELMQRQHEDTLALQREAMDKPVAAVQKSVSTATADMVENQEAERNNLRGIRSTYSIFARRKDDDDGGRGTKLGD